MDAQTVVLLHSSGSSPRQWSALARRLTARLGLRAVAPALVGHDGEPPWPGGAAPSLQGEVRRLRERLPRGTGGIHLVGHSYGGAVAIRAALSGRFDVRSLTVFEPPLFRMPGDGDGLDRYAAADSPITAGREVTRLFGAGALEASARLYVNYWNGPGEFERLPPERRARVAERMPAVVDCFHALFGDDLVPADLGRLDLPVLVMGGTRSPLPARDICEIVAAGAPRARLHWFSGMGHMGPVNEPARVEAVIEEFLGLQHPDLVAQQVEVAA